MYVGKTGVVCQNGLCTHWNRAKGGFDEPWQTDANVEHYAFDHLPDGYMGERDLGLITAGGTAIGETKPTA